MQKASSIPTLRSNPSISSSLPRMTIFLKKKHSNIKHRQDINLPTMSQKLKDRLHSIDNIPRRPSPTILPDEKYKQIYTHQKISSLCETFLSLHKQFRSLPRIQRRKLYQRLPIYLFNIDLIQLLHSPTTLPTITTSLTSYEHIRDFHIIVDWLEKFMTESRRRELESRERRLRGCGGGIWEDGLEERIEEIEREVGRLEKVGGFTRKMGVMIGRVVDGLRRGGRRGKGQEEEEEGQGAER